MRIFLNVEQLESRNAPAALNPVADLPRPTIFPKPDDPVYVRYQSMTDAEIDAARVELSKRIDRFEGVSRGGPSGAWGVVGFFVSGREFYSTVAQTVRLHQQAGEVKEVHHEINIIIFVRWERSQGR